VLLQAFPASLQAHGIKYLSGYAHSVPVCVFERVAAGFIEAVLEATMQAGVENTELGCIWNEVQKERSDPGLFRKRKLEAFLGFDPRKTWSLNNGPLSTSMLAEIFQISQEFILDGNDYPDLPLHVGFRNGGGDDEFKGFLSRRPVTSRRFALARLIADHLTAHKEDHLLPATGVYTQRQKFQRAFAQEFLCPFMAFRDYLGGGRPDDETIEEAASYFQVSPLMIRSTLVNKGMLEREILSERC
jgi:hypothetical protein